MTFPSMRHACVLAALTVAAATSDSVIPSDHDGCYTIGPDYVNVSAWEPCESCEQGNLFHLYMPIEGTAYNCDPEENPFLSAECSANGYCAQEWGIPGTRNITVYIPAAYQDGDEATFMVHQDGDDFIQAGFTNIMDRFIGAQDEAQSLPMFVLIAVGLVGLGQHGKHPCFSGHGSERNNEYITVSDKYGKFVANEVLPYVTNHPDIKSKFPNLKLTNDPAGRMTFGGSAGGVAALKMTFFTPDLFGIAMTYSAAIVFETDLTSKEEYPLGNAEMWAGQELIKNEPRKPMRIFLSAGERDMGAPNGCVYYGGSFFYSTNEALLNASGSQGVVTDEQRTKYLAYHNVLEANNKTKEALTAKGYVTHYAYGLGACHVDMRLMMQDIPNTLVWAWAEWKEKQSTQATVMSATDTSATANVASAALAFAGTVSFAIMVLFY